MKVILLGWLVACGGHIHFYSFFEVLIIIVTLRKQRMRTYIWSCDLIQRNSTYIPIMEELMNTYNNRRFEYS